MAAAPDLAADLEAVDLRKHQVEHHQVGVVPRVERQPLLAVGGADDAVALLFEIEPEQLDDVALVVHQQDSFHPGGGYGRLQGVVAPNVRGG